MKKIYVLILVRSPFLLLLGIEPSNLNKKSNENELRDFFFPKRTLLEEFFFKFQDHPLP